MADTPDSASKAQSERNLALLGYGLLFVAVCFAGVTALVAVIIAYVMRDSVSPAVRSHYQSQITIFWIDVMFVIASVVPGVSGGLLFLRGLISSQGQWQGVNLGREIVEQLNEFRYSGLAFGLLAASGLSALLGMLWMIVAPTIGFIRLATSRGMGQTPAS